MMRLLVYLSRQDQAAHRLQIIGVLLIRSSETLVDQGPAPDARYSRER